MIPGFWGFIKQGGILQGYPFAKNVWYVGPSSPVFGHRANTIKDALALMKSGDLLFLGNNAYLEGNLVIPRSLTNITIIGACNQHDAAIAPSVAAQNGILIYGNDVTFINLDLSDGGAGSYAVRVGDNTTAGQNTQRFKAYGCKFEGGSVGLALQGCADLLIDDCEFAWAPTGISLNANNHGFCTEIFIRNSRFHNFATDGIAQAIVGQVVDNLEVSDCIFDNAEGGVAPTHFINVANAANVGIITRNSFAIATNAVAKLIVGAGILWVANATEAGWSTARPA
jgi:hypothetical protein